MIGFGLSIILTIIAFGLVWEHIQTDHDFPSHELLLPVLIVLALIQFFVQVVLFLHVGSEEKPRYNLLALLFAILVVVIVVGGTLWIMGNLHHFQHLQ